MPLPESNPAAALAFDALVNRARARRVSDTPYPRTGQAVGDDAPAKTEATEQPTLQAPAAEAA
ncbi:MAG: hypothetical protein QM601_06635 [Pseudoxanthomonas sp.]